MRYLGFFTDSNPSRRHHWDTSKVARGAGMKTKLARTNFTFDIRDYDSPFFFLMAVSSGTGIFTVTSKEYKSCKTQQ